MTLNIAKEHAALQGLSVDQLRGRYGEVFGEPTGARHRGWLIKRILWRLQAQSEGGLSERARQRGAELAREEDLRLSPPKQSPTTNHRVVIAKNSGKRRLPAPGTVIERPYKGRTVQLKVLADGFECEGEIFGSLSAAAKHITGSRCNGYQFFRLTDKRGAQ